MSFLFKEQLHEFARFPYDIAGPFGFKSVLSCMTPDNLNPQTMPELLKESPLDIRAMVKTTLEEPFNIDPYDPRATIQAFTGEATVVVLENGIPIGYYEMADGPVHEQHGSVEYGHTLLPYAVRKGARRWHLESTFRSGGIKDPDNNRYLRGIGPEGVGVFIGDAKVNLINHGTLVVGVSGAQMTEEFLKLLVGGNVKEHTLELFAGLGDVVAAEGIAQRLKNPTQSITRVSPDILQLTTWH